MSVESKAPSFAGFDPPAANFTPAPNQFFDQVVGHYPLRVVTVVAILIRETLGWRDGVTGERRIEAELPLPAFVRPDLSLNSARQGLREAIEAGFVVETAAHTNIAGARYALRWANGDQLREAVERQRRAVGDTRPFGVGDTKSGGPKNGGPKNGGQDSGGPNSAPPTNTKKRSESKKDVSVNKPPKTLNVTGEQNTQKSTDSDVNDGTSEGISSVVVAVREALAVTGDTTSAARFIQLREICEEEAQTEVWEEALASTVRAKAAGRLRGPAGAYFNGTLARILQKRGFYVPTGKPEEREELQSEILASLAAAGAGGTE